MENNNEPTVPEAVSQAMNAPMSDQNTITEIYKVLAPMAGDYMNAQAQQIGQAQQSMGPLAAQTMGSTTAGLGNYTYNRLMRPQVDTMRDEILVRGYTNQLNRLLADSLNNARNRYNRYARSGNGSTEEKKDDPDNKGTTGVTTISGSGTQSTGSGNTTSYTALPNSFKWEDANGNMQTSTRPPVMSDAEWLQFYESKKKEAQSAGRKFEG